MALFQDKVGRKRLGKKEKRNYRSVPFRSYTKRNRKFQKKSKKIQKTKKQRDGFISSQSRSEKAGKERK